MKRLAFTLLAGVLGSVLSIVAQSPQEPTADDWKWLNQSHDQVFDALMPMDSSDVVVAYRGSRGVDVLERYFAVRFDPVGDFNKNKLIASVVIATGRPISQQLLDIHMRDRATPIAAVQSQLSFRRLDVNSGTCRALRTQMDKLSRISVAIPDRQLIPLDPTSHKFVINLADHIQAVLFDERSPLVRWALQTNDDLVECGSRQGMASHER